MTTDGEFSKVVLHGHKKFINFKRSGNSEMDVTDKTISSVNALNGSTVVSETNYVQGHMQWFVDTVATRHICSDKYMFSTYQELDHEEELYMGNSDVSMVKGCGQVILKFTSGKEVTLNDVLHAPDIRKNLIYGSMLSNEGFWIAIVSDEMVLTKARIYVGKRMSM